MEYSVKEKDGFTQIEFQVNGLILVFQNGSDIDAFSPIHTAGATKLSRDEIEEACTQLENDGYEVDRSVGLLS